MRFNLHLDDEWSGRNLKVLCDCADQLLKEHPSPNTIFPGMDGQGIGSEVCKSYDAMKDINVQLREISEKLLNLEINSYNE